MVYRYKNFSSVWRHHTVKMLNFGRLSFLRRNLLNLPAHLTPVLFNSSDLHEMYLDKPPDDALNMRLT